MIKPQSDDTALRTILMVVVTSVIMVACKPSVPDQYLQPGVMEDILYDYYVSKATANHSGNSAYERSAYYYATLRKHGVTEAEFDSSLVYYYTHAERLNAIYNSVTKRLSDEAKRLGASVGELGEYANLTANGDTSNVWTDATSAILMPVPPFNRVDFTLKADTAYHRGDSFLLSFVTDFMYQSGMKDLVAYVAVTYTNDSVAVSQTHVSMSGLNKMSIGGNDNDDIKRIDGFLYLTRGATDNATQKMLFVHNIQLIRFHSGKSTAAINAVGPPKSDSATRPRPDTTTRMIPIKGLPRQ